MPRRTPTPPRRLVAATAVAGGLLAASIGLVRAVRPPDFRIADPEGRPTLDASGRARSVQTAELTLRPATLAAIWSPGGLDRLGRAYWRFLTLITLGLIRVIQTPDAVLVVLLARPAVLLAFGPPDCRLESDRGLITWQIRGGLLAAGRPNAPAGGAGLLRMEIRRLGWSPAGRPSVRVEVSVGDFLPMIARHFGPAAYARTQAQVHVFVTHSFMRSLARARLAAPCRLPAESASPLASRQPSSRWEPLRNIRK